VSVCRAVVRGWRSVPLRHSRPCPWSRARLEQACMVDADVRSRDPVSAEYVILRRRDRFSRPRAAPSRTRVGNRPLTRHGRRRSGRLGNRRSAAHVQGPDRFPCRAPTRYSMNVGPIGTTRSASSDATRSQEPSADTSAHKKTDVSTIVASRRGQLAQSCRRVARLGPEHRRCDAALAVRGHVHPCGGPGPVRVCDQLIRAIQTDPARLPAPASRDGVRSDRGRRPPAS
jgi:hypothetical protein